MPPVAKVTTFSNSNAPGDDHIVFTVQVTHNTIWKVYRRYNDFKVLYDQLKSKYSEVPKLPGTAYFGSKSKQFLEARRVGLEDWISNVLSLKPIGKCQEVKLFLTFGKDEPPQGLERHPFAPEEPNEVAPPAKVETVVKNEELAEKAKSDPAQVAKDEALEAKKAADARRETALARRALEEDTRGVMSALCPTHTHQPLSLYCVEKLTLVCATCVMKNLYPNATFTEIPQASEERFAAIHVKIQALIDKELQITELLDQVQNTQSAISSLAEEKEAMVQEVMNSFHVNVDVIEDGMVEEILEQEGILVNKLQKQSSDRRALVRLFRRLGKRISDDLLEKDPIKFLNRWGAPTLSPLERECDATIKAYVSQRPVCSAEVPRTMTTNEHGLPPHIYEELTALSFDEDRNPGVKSSREISENKAIFEQISVQEARATQARRRLKELTARNTDLDAALLELKEAEENMAGDIAV